MKNKTLKLQTKLAKKKFDFSKLLVAQQDAKIMFRKIDRKKKKLKKELSSSHHKVYMHLMHNKRTQGLRDTKNCAGQKLVRVQDFSNTLPLSSDYFKSHRMHDQARMLNRSTIEDQHSSLIRYKSPVKTLRPKPRSVINRSGGSSSIQFIKNMDLKAVEIDDFDENLSIDKSQKKPNRARLNCSNSKHKQPSHKFVENIKNAYQVRPKGKRCRTANLRKKKRLKNNSVIFKIVKNYKPIGFTGTVSLNPRLVLETPQKPIKSDYTFSEVRPKFTTSRHYNSTSRAPSKRPSTSLTSPKPSIISENSIMHQNFLKFLKDHNIKVNHSSSTSQRPSTSSLKII
ncbi:unnamed protein product [Moneuplotes crassus]|uniref:Uncharacterized protein n=1 Tax=Euplotes crassus TaxID=5936 RepID=A0AAD1XIL5_EUPCR|nr:unnamed protein product [Moneuplotes crassus]